MPRHRPLLVGERINAHGSRRARALLLANDHDALVALAQEQVAQGAAALDLHVALPGDADSGHDGAGHDGAEAQRMWAVAARLATAVDVPLLVDSTDARVLIRVLEGLRHRAVANSVSLAHDRAAIDAVAPVVRRHGARLVALCIDEAGIARTTAGKIAVARRLYDIIVGEHGLAPDALIIDPLALAIARGDPRPASAAADTLESLRVIKGELSGVSTLLGISDVSYGLPPVARRVLNSAFLYHAGAAGLDMAIADPGAIEAYAELRAEERQLADDLLFNRRPDALARFAAVR